MTARKIRIREDSVATNFARRAPTRSSLAAAMLRFKNLPARLGHVRSVPRVWVQDPTGKSRPSHDAAGPVQAHLENGVQARPRRRRPAPPARALSIIAARAQFVRLALEHAPTGRSSRRAAALPGWLGNAQARPRLGLQEYLRQPADHAFSTRASRDPSVLPVPRDVPTGKSQLHRATLLPARPNQAYPSQAHPKNGLRAHPRRPVDLAPLKKTWLAWAHDRIVPAGHAEKTPVTVIAHPDPAFGPLAPANRSRSGRVRASAARASPKTKAISSGGRQRVPIETSLKVRLKVKAVRGDQ